VLEHLLTFFAGTQRSEERTLDAVSTARVLTRQAGRAHPWREEWFSRAANRRFPGRLQMLPMHVLVPARFPADARSRVAYDVLPRWDAAALLPVCPYADPEGREPERAWAVGKSPQRR